MKRATFVVALMAACAGLLPMPGGVRASTIGGHNETSENFLTGGWTVANMTPGTVLGSPTASHLVFSEIAPRGAGTGAASDSSEYIEIYNPTPNPVALGDKYVSDDLNYYKIVNGPYAVTNNTDWTARFPAGLVLDPGRTLVLCMTKAGFAGSGASAPAAQYVLEMKDSNGNAADDMVVLTTNSTFPVTGGNLTNPSSSNGEWVVLFHWDGVSDLVCDIDYASWGANASSNPKLDKTGLSIDGPDAGSTVSTFLPDTSATAQSNLGGGTTLTKPNTYQRTGGEVGERPAGGNGCVGRVAPSIVEWTPVADPAGGTDIRFHVRWQNQDADEPSPPVSGTMSAQEFGVFLPDAGPIGAFDVPAMLPNGFFDVFFDVPLANLPAPPQKIVPGAGGAAARSGGTVSLSSVPAHTAFDCPADTNWAGNVDIQWSGVGQGGQVNKHYGDLLSCAGGAPSYIHFRPSNCTAPMAWTISGLCPGFTVALVNEDFTPAPNPVPVGWSGWIQVNAAASVPSGTSCCFNVTFTCLDASSTIQICSTACECQAHPPTLTQVDWATISGTTVRFHTRWENGSTSGNSDPVSGDMHSQSLGVFLPDFGPIGHFDVPAIAPGSFFDVFLDVPLSQLPPEPALTWPGAGTSGPAPCTNDHWHGNVNITWTSASGPGQVFKHFGEMPTCPGGAPTDLFVETDCLGGAGATWTIAAACPNFHVTLVNTDGTPAPNPVPPGWVGLIRVNTVAGTPPGASCCFKVKFLCNGVPGVIDVCAYACKCPRPKPVLQATDWTRLGDQVRFHLHWTNDDPAQATDPVSGSVQSQPFGAFAPDFGPIGQFDVPSIAPGSFFDVFLDAALSDLPPEPQRDLPGGGPDPGSPCPQDTSWSGNVDIQWSGTGGAGQVNRHFTSLLVQPGVGSSHVHTLVFCNSAAGATWSIAGVCPGFHATLLNEDFSVAPNPVPPNWTGWISVAADAGVPAGTACCFAVTFSCDGVPGVIDVCAETCTWPVTGVGSSGPVQFGIYATAPNPTSGDMAITFGMPHAGTVRLEIFDVAGHRVRKLLDGAVGAGMSAQRWDGRGDDGRQLRPGAYFVRFRSGERIATKKITLFR